MANNLAISSFERVKPSVTSSDYLKNKKSKLTYCNGNSCTKLTQASSYDQKNLFNNGQYLDSIEGDPLTRNYKYGLITTLHTAMDLSGVKVVTDLSDNEVTCVDISLIPFYENYSIDYDSKLFGNTPCSLNNYVTFQKLNSDYVPPTDIRFSKYI